MLTYPMTTGRNFDEVLRILDSVQLTAKHPVATPVNWKPGGDVIIAGSVSDEEAQKRYPGFRAPKPYLRYTAQPRKASDRAYCGTVPGRPSPGAAPRRPGGPMPGKGVL